MANTRALQLLVRDKGHESFEEAPANNFALSLMHVIQQVSSNINYLCQGTNLQLSYLAIVRH